MPLPALAGVAMRHRLAGLEFGVAIPASLGGAVKMNAGAHDGSMSEVIERVEVYSLAGHRQALPVGAGRRVRVPPLEPARGRDRGRCVREAQARRRRGDPSPDGGGARVAPAHTTARRAELRVRFQESRRRSRRQADRVGRSEGAPLGGAQVSEKHSNFIVADPGASSSDVWALIEQVRALVESHAGVRLETEVELMGGGRSMRAADAERRVLRRWTIAAFAIVLVATLAVAATYTALFAAKDIRAPRIPPHPARRDPLAGSCERPLERVPSRCERRRTAAGARSEDPRGASDESRSRMGSRSRSSSGCRWRSSAPPRPSWVPTVS